MNLALGNFALVYFVKLSGMGGRGRVDEDQGSVGPGMNRK